MGIPREPTAGSLNLNQRASAKSGTIHHTFAFYIHEGKILKIHEYFDIKLADIILLPLLNEMGLGH